MKVNEEVLKKFNRNVLLYFSGEYRNANKILTSQKRNIQKKASTREIMKEIQDIGFQSYDCLKKGKLQDYGYLLDKHYELKRRISSDMSSNKLNDIYEYGKSNGSIGGKNIGAGGGGLFMFYVPSSNKKKFRKAMNNKKLVELKWNFEKNGVTLFKFST